MSRRKFRLPRIPVAGIAASALGLAFLIAVFEFASVMLDRPIQAIDIEAPLKRVTLMQIRAAAEPEVAMGFISADLGAVRRRLEALSWVDEALVRRRWPDRLEILLAEQIPAARWMDTGLLNTRGELFMGRARHIPSELPRLSGPEGSAPQVAARYLAMNGPLIEAGLGLAAVNLDTRGAWQLTLTNGVEVRLGRRDVETRSERFLSIASDIVAQRQSDIAYVDMRYFNGFSIGWKNPGARPDVEVDPDARELTGLRLGNTQRAGA